MSQILFVGGGLDSVTGSGLAENNGGFHDTTYAPSCLLVGPGLTATATCLDSTVTPTTVTNGQTFFGHFGFNFTNAYATGNPVVVLNDSAGFPWVSIRSNGGSPTFGVYYNSNTGASPTWTQVGANFTMNQNSAPYQRLDISVIINTGGSHTVTVWNREVQVAVGTFTQASFTNIKTMGLTGAVGGSGEFWELIMTEGQSTVGARVGYSLANAIGTTSGWTGVFGNVNPVVCTDATTNTSGTAAQKTTYNFADIVVPATNTIKCVWQWIRGKNDGTAPSNIKVVCRSAGTDYPGASNVPGITTAYSALPGRYDVDPATGVAWTQTGFNAAEFGYLSA